MVTLNGKTIDAMGLNDNTIIYTTDHGMCGLDDG